VKCFKSSVAFTLARPQYITIRYGIAIVEEVHLPNLRARDAVNGNQLLSYPSGFAGGVRHLGFLYKNNKIAPPPSVNIH
jgi:hypothetical protein